MSLCDILDRAKGTSGNKRAIDKWLDLHRQQIEETRRNGDTVAEIEVKYHEFVEFCRTTGATPDANTLLDFTVKQAGWKS